MKRLILVVAVATATAAIIVASASGAGGGNKTYAPKDCSKPVVEPSRIVFTCADFGSYISKLHWGHWGGQKARGSGTFYEKVCNPSCASGHLAKYHADIRLRNPRMSKCGGKRVRLFHRAKVHFTNRKPQDARHFRNTKIFCNK
jgi:hypothetical protein